MKNLLPIPKLVARDQAKYVQSLSRLIASKSPTSDSYCMFENVDLHLIITKAVLKICQGFKPQQMALLLFQYNCQGERRVNHCVGRPCIYIVTSDFPLQSLLDLVIEMQLQLSATQLLEMLVVHFAKSWHQQPESADILLSTVLLDFPFNVCCFVLNYGKFN